MWRRCAPSPWSEKLDLRHTGSVLAAEAGANLRELMDRMGHSTTRAAYVDDEKRKNGDEGSATGTVS